MKNNESNITTATNAPSTKNPKMSNKPKTAYFDKKGKKLDWFDCLEHRLLVLLGSELESVEEFSGTQDQYRISNSPEGTRKELVQRGTPAYRRVTFKDNPAFPAKAKRFKAKCKKLWSLLLNLVKGLIVCCLSLLGFIILMLTLRHFVPELGESMKAVFDFIENWALPMVNRAFSQASKWLCEHCM